MEVLPEEKKHLEKAGFSRVAPQDVSHHIEASGRAVNIEDP
jgi:hypothetical protein